MQATVSADRSAALLQQSVLPTLVRLAAPNVLVILVQAASTTVDGFYVSRLGATAIAGVALVVPVWMLMVTLSAGGIGGAIASAVARALGAGQRHDAESLLVQAVALALACAGLTTALVLLGGPALYAALGGSGDALSAALAYSNVVFAGALAVWLVNCLTSVLRGHGDMLFPAGVMIGGELLHIVLAPALIFGFGPVPSLGVAGGGASLVSANALRALALGVYVLSGRAGIHRPARIGLDGRLIKEVLRVGVPGSLNTVMTNLNVIAVTGFVGRSGTLALAGYGIGARLEYLQIPLVFGVGTALVTLVGTSVGAGDYARARRIAWTGAALAAAVTGGIGLLTALVPSLWLGLFTRDADVVQVGATYLRTVGPAYGLFGGGLALYFATQGAGRVLWPVAGGFARFVVVVGGGYAATVWSAGNLSAVFAAVSAGMLVSFISLSLATWRLRPSRQRASINHLDAPACVGELAYPRGGVHTAGVHVVN